MADRRFLGVRRGLFFLVGTSKTKSSHRLQRDLGRERRCKAQVKKRSRLGPQGSIFGQIAAGLAHDPHRPPLRHLAAAGTQEEIVHRCRIADRPLPNSPPVV